MRHQGCQSDEHFCPEKVQNKHMYLGSSAYYGTLVKNSASRTYLIAVKWSKDKKVTNKRPLVPFYNHLHLSELRRIHVNTNKPNRLKKIKETDVAMSHQGCQLDK